MENFYKITITQDGIKRYSFMEKAESATQAKEAGYLKNHEEFKFEKKHMSARKFA